MEAKFKQKSYLAAVFGALLVTLFLLGGIGYVLAWHFGLFKTKTAIAPEAEQVRQQIVIIQSTTQDDITRIFQNPELINFLKPIIIPTELGKSNIFE